MGNYTIFLKFENPRRGRQARNLSENDPKIVDLKSSSEQIIFRNLSLGAPAYPSCAEELRGQDWIVATLARDFGLWCLTKGS